MSAQKPVDMVGEGPSSPGPDDASFEAWYAKSYKIGFERGPTDKYTARIAWFAALSERRARDAAVERLIEAADEVVNKVDDGFIGGPVYRLRRALAAVRGGAK